MTQLTNTVERSTERSDKRFDEFMTTAKGHWERSEDLHRHMLAVMTASCLISANSSVDSRDRCLQVGRFAAD